MQKPTLSITAFPPSHVLLGSFIEKGISLTISVSFDASSAQPRRSFIQSTMPISAGRISIRVSIQGLDRSQLRLFRFASLRAKRTPLRSPSLLDFAGFRVRFVQRLLPSFLFRRKLHSGVDSRQQVVAMALPGSVAKCKLSTSIQASFGSPDDPDYVFDIAANGDNSTMAVSLSTNAIKLYAPATGQYLGDCLGHTNTVSDISFPDASSPNVLCSSSADGTVRAWDIRLRKEVATLRTDNQELWSFDIGGSTQNLVASGGNAAVICWDRRTNRQVAMLEECHTEAVTQVRFHPIKKEKLVSASVDGLMCVFSTIGDINDDEGMDSVMSVGTSIAKIGFYGKNHERIWCQTHIETVSSWNFEDALLEADFSEMRADASSNWSFSPVEYLIRCFYIPTFDTLWLLAGTQEGTIGYFPLHIPTTTTTQLSSGTGAAAVVGPASAVLEGGHTGVVRSVWSPSDNNNNNNVDVNAGGSGLEGLFCWTGGEDGRLCCWAEDSGGVHARTGAWVSSGSGLVTGGKKGGSRHKQRRAPY